MNFAAEYSFELNAPSQVSNVSNSMQRPIPQEHEVVIDMTCAVAFQSAVTHFKRDPHMSRLELITYLESIIPPKSNPLYTKFLSAFLQKLREVISKIKQHLESQRLALEAGQPYYHSPVSLDTVSAYYAQNHTNKTPVNGGYYFEIDYTSESQHIRRLP